MLTGPLDETVSPITAVVLVVYAIWFLASAYGPLWSLAVRVAPVHVAFGRPVLTLFESSPEECQLYYRDRSTDGRIGRWQSAIPVQQRALIHLFWNPRFRLHLGLHFNLRALGIQADTLEPHTVRDTPAYRLVWNYVSAFPRTADSKARQFVVVRGILHDRSATIRLRSPFHDL